MQLDPNRLRELKRLQEIIGIAFNSIELLNNAFIHPSYTNEQNSISSENNQRLEFLGDAVLELVVSHYLYEKYPEMTEGQMTKARAYTVCEQSLAAASKNLLLGDYLVLGKGEENTGGREKPSILADTFEALIGAIYLDKNIETARQFIIKNLEGVIQKAVEGEESRDYKTLLQEMLQKLSPERVCYEVVKEEGPDHAKVFHVEVLWKGEVMGMGSGKSKKEAEQLAAKQALNNIK
ncbi:MAG TPA: ribonuclease III [Thermoanaerobacterales bacterium]|nr:ribonuclease III [Thermoanaerobacterales bacterium]